MASLLATFYAMGTDNSRLLGPTDRGKGWRLRIPIFVRPTAKVLSFRNIDTQRGWITVPRNSHGSKRQMPEKEIDGAIETTPAASAATTVGDAPTQETDQTQDQAANRGEVIPLREIMTRRHDLPGGGGQNARNRALFEIHYRIPREIPHPFLATHITFIRRTTEDRHYEEAESIVPLNFSLSLAKDFANRVFADMPTRYKDIATNDREIKAVSKFTEAEVEREAIKIIDDLTESYREVLKHNAPLFVFGAPRRIVDLTSRKVADKTGDHPVLDIMVSHFSKRFFEYYEKISAPMFKDLSDRFRSQDPNFISRELGGLRHWFETTQNSSGPDKMDALYEDFRHFNIRAPFVTNYNEVTPAYTLRWARHPQAWNYTFIEAPARREAEISPPVPGLTAETLLCDMVVSYVLDPNVVHAQAFDSAETERNFPGAGLAGAHYFLLSIDDFLAISCANPKILRFDDTNEVKAALRRLRAGANGEKYARDVALENQRIAKFVDSFTNGWQNRVRMVQGLYDFCIEKISDRSINNVILSHATDAGLRSNLRAIMANPNSNRASKAKAIWDQIKPESTGPGRVRIPSFYGALVRACLFECDLSEADRDIVYQKIGAILDEFWRSSVSAVTDASEPGHFATTDHVCSQMLEGRCVYFSNFVPLGPEKFTRTIFVDLRMTGWQRGRMLQRLSDILTYRSIPIRDLGRVQGAFEALHEVTAELNDIQVTVTNRLTSHVGDSKPTMDEVTPKETAAMMDEGEVTPDVIAASNKRNRRSLGVIHNDLERTLAMSAKVGRMNSFITYGVSGKFFSADSYLIQIRERCADLREKRIIGFAQLGDFVERRLAHSIRSVQRLYLDHRDISERISDLTERVRTELESLQTAQIVDNLSAQTEAARDFKVAAGNLQTATSQVGKLLFRQLALTRAADGFALVGGTYYAKNLITDLLSKSHTHISAIGAIDTETPSPWETLAVYAYALCVAVAARLIGGWLIERLENGIRWVRRRIDQQIKNKWPTAVESPLMRPFLLTEEDMSWPLS